MRTAGRLTRIDPFYVLECAKEAQRIAATPACDPAQGGEPMIFLNIGEPDFSAPPEVVAAAERCLAAGLTQYTQATGLPALREALSRWYAEHHGLAIDPARIVITAGASAALQLVCLALFEAGDEVLMPDPSYPCNRHFVAAADATPVLMPCGPAQRYQPDAAQIEAAWTPATRGVLLASPSNPTGTSIAHDDLRGIVEVVRARGGIVLVDEIYLGLSYESAFSRSALTLGDDIVSINSFSKSFCMTGWRLGWLVLPEALVPSIDKLAQNLFICASSLAQHAALACFGPATLAEVERRRLAFKARRDAVLPRLAAMGLSVPVQPDGAFYAWIDASAHTDDGWALAFELMRTAHVALTPGRDFGRQDVGHHLRLSYAAGLDQIERAMARIERVLANRPRPR